MIISKKFDNIYTLDLFENVEFQNLIKEYFGNYVFDKLINENDSVNMNLNIFSNTNYIQIELRNKYNKEKPKLDLYPTTNGMYEYSVENINLSRIIITDKRGKNTNKVHVKLSVDIKDFN